MWMFVHPTHLVLSSATLLYEIYCGSFLVRVPSTTAADCSLFNNHRNKKVVGGSYNVLVYYKNASAHNLEGAVLYFWSKACCLLCAFHTTVDCNLFNNHRNKSMVGGNYNVPVFYKNANAPGPEGVVLCNTFK